MLEEIDFSAPFKTIGIVGTGLIGGSYGKAIKENIEAVEVVGFDLNPTELSNALEVGCIDKAAGSLIELAQTSDLIVLATPVRTYEAILREIPEAVWENTWLTDLGSVKTHPHKLVNQLLPHTAKFVGGHPMAGSEKCGCINGTASLFENAAFYLTSENPQWIAPIAQIVEAIGGVVKCIDFNEHDRIVSVSSHVPHIAASMLVSILHDDISINETGGGYQDTTRIAGSDPVMWTDILLTNKKELLTSLDRLHAELHKVIGMIDKEDSEGIYKFLETTRDKRLGGNEESGDHNRRKAI
jgi:prephenate dehydrogenase